MHKPSLTRSLLGISSIAGMLAGANLKQALVASHIAGYRGEMRRREKLNNNKCINKHPGIRNPKVAANVQMMHERWARARGFQP